MVETIISKIDGGLFLIIGLAVLLYIGVNWIFGKILKVHDNLTNRFLRKVARCGVLLLAGFLLLEKYSLLGNITSTLLTNSALIVAVLGFLLQNVLKNILAGAMLLSSDTFKVGDRIRMPEKNVSGVIESLNMRHTVVLLETNERAIIPNSLLHDSIVVNNNIHDSSTCYPLIIVIGLDKDISIAKTIVEAHIMNDTRVLESTRPTIVTTVTKDTVELKTMVWTKDLDTSFATISDLRESILNELREKDYFS